MQISTRHNVGGISKLIIELLGDPNFDQLYVTGSCEYNEKEFTFDLTTPNLQGVNVIKIPYMKRSINLMNDFISFFTLVKIIWIEKPDVIHTHMSKAGLLGRLAAKVSFGKIRLIHSYHGHVLDGYFNRHLGKLFILIEKCLGKITDVFIFDSLSVKKEINTYRIFPKSEQHIILPGLIREVVGSHKFIEPLQKMIILVVARIEPVKRIDLVLSIAKDLKLRYANLEFEVNVVGDGQLKKELEQIAKNSQLPVKFLGWKDSVDAEYINSHVLLSTSDSEGTPISFMEAASFGLPIITTNVGGVSDLVEHNVTGLVIDGCVTEFSDAIHRLWMNPQVLLDLSMEATKKSKAEFSALRFRKKHRDVYENLFKV